jgi:cold shock CspA family protein
MLGTVVVFNRDLGYGRVRPDSARDLGELGEVYVGRAELPRGTQYLVGLQRIEFNVVYRRRYRRWQACDVRLIPATAPLAAEHRQQQ